MTSWTTGVLVAELLGDGRLIVHGGKGPRQHARIGDTAATDDKLASFAMALADQDGVEVRCVVVIAAEHSDGPFLGEARHLRSYPRHMYCLSPSLAVAYADDHDAGQLLILRDGDPSAARIVIRTAGGLVERAIRVESVFEAVRVCRMMNVEHVVVYGDDAEGMSATLGALLPTKTRCAVVDKRAVVTGALRFAATRREEHAMSRLSATVTRLEATRRVGYSVHRTAGSALDVDDTTLADVVRDRPALVVVDRGVHALYGEALETYGRRHLDVRGVALLSAREADKTWLQVERLCGVAADAGIDRRGVIIGVGGGVTLDIAGLAASVYRRGIAYVRVPTTLVGLIDVSLGIKQAVNACGRKSLVGAFHAPLACVNDYDFLRTLDSAEIAYGLAEVVKIALVRDVTLFEELEESAAALAATPALCAAPAARAIWNRAECLMLEELCPNLYETTLARLVDFGHTFSPTIETESGYAIAHGHAVALDMLISTAIGVRQQLCAPRLFDRLLRVVDALGLATWHPVLSSVDRLRRALDAAQMHRGGLLNLVVPCAAGTADFVQSVSDDDLQFATVVMRSATRDWLSAATALGVA